MFSQCSSQKKDILKARELEQGKEKRKEHCANLPRELSLQDNRCYESYPTEFMSWGKGFYDGLGKITVNGKVGFINTYGQIVIQPKLIDAGHFAENLAPYEDIEGKWGFINTLGKVVIKPQFDWALSFKEGLAIVQIDELWGFIDLNGIIVIKSTFVEAESFSEGLAGVGIDDENYVWENTNRPNGKRYWGFIDKQGNWIIKPTLNYVYRDFNGGMALVSSNIGNKHVNQSEKYFIDINGTKLWTLNSWYISKFSNDALVVIVGEDKQGNNKYSFIDRSGKRMTEISFANVSEFSEGLSAAKTTFEGKYGFVNKKGNFVIKPKFDLAFQFSEGLAGVGVGYSNYGYIDKSGKLIIKPQFGWVWQFQEGFALVAPDGDDKSREKTGYIDRKGNYIWTPTK